MKSKTDRVNVFAHSRMVHHQSDGPSLLVKHPPTPDFEPRYKEFPLNFISLNKVILTEIYIPPNVQQHWNKIEASNFQSFNFF